MLLNGTDYIKMYIDKNKQAFLEILKAGLFSVHGEKFKDEPSGRAERIVNESLSKDVDWGKVYLLAKEQSVQGLVLQGIEAVREPRLKGLETSGINDQGRAHGSPLVPHRLLLQWIGAVQKIEKRNKAMNAYLAMLIDKLRKHGIYAILVKGQGIAQCYERPLWRCAGDVDLFLSNDNYQKAIVVLAPLAKEVEDENSYTKHLGFKIDNWNVELHGSLRSELWKRLDNMLDEVQYEILCGGRVRSWQYNNVQIFLPRADEDVVYVFAHILQHFFKGGIGLRQVCDWCRLLWRYYGTLNLKLLESRLCKAGIMSEWKTFAALAVNTLGMPKEAMPFYAPSSKWQRKAERVLEFILETGNFGHNRDMSFLNHPSSIARKAMHFRQITKDSLKQYQIFPLDSLRVWWSLMKMGLRSLLGK